MATVEAVFEELNFPSAPRLKRVLSARGIPFNASDVDRIVRGEATRQVQAPTYKFDGKIAASRLHSRWFAGLVDFLQLLPRARVGSRMVEEIEAVATFAFPGHGANIASS